MPTAHKLHVKVADEVWIATALLHQEQPTRADFPVEEIVARVAREALVLPLRPGVYVHVVQQAVANRAPGPGRYRMLFETAPGRRRLFRRGDSYHPAREGSKITPNPDEIPPGYSGLLSWYNQWDAAAVFSAPDSDPLLSLAGSGKQLWSSEHADEYIQRLRESWQ